MVRMLNTISSLPQTTKMKLWVWRLKAKQIQKQSIGQLLKLTFQLQLLSMYTRIVHNMNNDFNNNT